MGDVGVSGWQPGAEWHRPLLGHPLPTSVKMMAVIQKRLLGRGMESMAQRKTRMGRKREMTEAVTMLLRMMMK